MVLTLAGSAWAQILDPRDSIILESKTVAPQFGPSAGQPVMRVRMSITNKDSLNAWVLMSEVKTVTGNAYATLGRSNNGTGPRNNASVYALLNHPVLGTTTLNTLAPLSVTRYHSDSPDSFGCGGFFTAGDDATKEPPNATRRAFLELKFDSITGQGQFIIDTVQILATRTGFTRVPLGQRVNVNFVKAIITVDIKGDLNADGAVNTFDFMQLLNCIFAGYPPFKGTAACDLDCNGLADASDVVTFINAAYLGIPFPC